MRAQQVIDEHYCEKLNKFVKIVKEEPTSYNAGQSQAKYSHW